MENSVAVKLERNILHQFLGGNSEGVPPVPIPNTAVKPFSGDGTATSRGGRVTRRQEFL